ncbi:C-mannosyltransferase dpy-19 homolog [Condylostylus longicornis]|uniref:C-mannosyltransferase dpy-19 homolog n=1 Tax=Condylostylus longicornis TaxID=2530218 RepID=UPI00244DBA2B|nr:C-mannosyltransferase dpy-19 homolog [Condylostylus longicornis]
MKEKNYLVLLISHAFIGIGFFFLYVHYVRTIFEARTNFGHLTKLGKEALLREDALYFSFYKTIIEENNFWDGYKKLLNYTDIEYPNGINLVKRFHVLPEIFIGYCYHYFKSLSSKFGFPIISCWSNEKNLNGNNGDIICDGIGEPFYFYLEFLWAMGGFTVFFLYMYGSFLSENIFGGIYAVVLYIIFHKNASKIYERPVARENFAFPFIFWQMFYLSLCIEKSDRYVSNKFKIIMLVKLVILTTISLLCWQFSSVIFATQIIILITPWSIGLFSNWFSIYYAISHFASTLLAYYFSYGNKKYFLSWQNGPALALFSISFFYNRKTQPKFSGITSESIRGGTLGIFYAFSSQGFLIDLLEKSGFTKADDNPYSIYRDLILHWTLQRRANFTTSLLACHSDYIEASLNDLWELIKTLFVKPYCLYGVVILAKFFRKWRRAKNPHERSLEQKERAKNYILEDFMEENHITIKEMTNKETEMELNCCFKLLEECNYDYEKYKKEKNRIKKESKLEHDDFMNDVKKLKDQIKEKRLEENIQKGEKKIIYTSNNYEKPKFNDPSADNSNEKTSNNNSSASNKKVRKIEKVSDKYNNNHYVYSVAQLIMFFIIGLSLKKLFFLCFTQGCVIAPTLCSKFWYRKQNNVFWTISLVVFFTSIVDPGLHNIQQEHLPETKTSGDLQNMLEWISLNTEEDAVFGGPVEIIGTVHLATRRPIVNHAHLDMRQISGRTEKIYSVFSRQESSEIFNHFSQLKIQYLVLSFNDCSNSSSFDECDILTIWDEIQPTFRKYPQFCAELFNKNIPSFLKIFANKNFGIIKMFSQSVQLNLRYNKMSEKIM